LVGNGRVWVVCAWRRARRRGSSLGGGQGQDDVSRCGSRADCWDRDWGVAGGAAGALCFGMAVP
jgi:hypothetical protein